jgi:2-keto-4-pentenoate hydratase/2-oxohepta-3-ene-1,7-dioic acid hydratase in catechol pathway
MLSQTIHYAGVGVFESGDVVEVRIENIGTLRNYVVGQSPWMK